MKNKILNCAIKVYMSEGYKNFSMRKVAKCAEITATAIYRHFENKDDLILAIVSEGFRLLERFVLNVAKEEASEKERLILTQKSYLDFALSYPIFYELMFMRGSNIGDIMRSDDEKYKQMRGTFLMMVERVSACMNKGDIRKADPMKTAFKIFAFAHGTVSLYLADRIRMDKEQFDDEYMEALTEYIELL